MPETPLRETRGFTIQNRASLSSSPSALFSIFAVTRIFVWLSVRFTFVTFPISTSLYLMEVLPGSIPSAAWNVIRIVGPSFRYCWTTIPTRDQRGDDRDDPYDGDPRASFSERSSDCRNVREIGVFSHLSPAFPGWNPRSGGGRTIPPRKSSG